MLELIKKWFESKFHVHNWETVDKKQIDVYENSLSKRPYKTKVVYIQVCKTCQKVRVFKDEY